MHLQIIIIMKCKCTNSGLLNNKCKNIPTYIQEYKACSIKNCVYLHPFLLFKDMHNVSKNRKQTQSHSCLKYQRF